MRVETTYEVFKTIMLDHMDPRKEAPRDLVLFATSSDEGDMYTQWGLKGADHPLMEARTTWDRGEQEFVRVNEKHQYWLCVNVKEDED